MMGAWKYSEVGPGAPAYVICTPSKALEIMALPTTVDTANDLESNSVDPSYDRGLLAKAWRLVNNSLPSTTSSPIPYARLL
jgi:hypothetical protein